MTGNIDIEEVFKEWLAPIEYSVFLPYCTGNGIDVCCGHRIWPGAVGIDNVIYGQPYEPTAPEKKSIAQLVYDAMDLPFKDGVLDFVICIHGMEHLPDVKAAVKEFSRVLKPGGYLCLLTPDIRFVTITDKGRENVPHGLLPDEFREIVNSIKELRIVSFDTIKNNWAFDCVALKLGGSRHRKARPLKGRRSSSETSGGESQETDYYKQKVDELEGYTKGLEETVKRLEADCRVKDAELVVVSQRPITELEKNNKAKQAEIDIAAKHIAKLEDYIKDKEAEIRLMSEHIKNIEQILAEKTPTQRSHPNHQRKRTTVTPDSTSFEKFRFYLENEGMKATIRRSISVIKRKPGK
ncbi:MAG: methyltransferase domain-containing protein [Actinobacteria bacterium]|nr:methyltransferase domain-containing protein [Actinomycetota bacterium]